MKKYTFWVKAAAVFMLLTAAVHLISLFVAIDPQNDTERQLVEAISKKLDMGAGFHRSFANLFTALSSCFSLLCLLGGLLVFYLGRKIPDAQIWKGILNINLLVFGICFVVMAVFTFLPPIILTGLIFLSLILARLTVPKTGTQ
jgi:hypothetical protein